MKQEILLVLCRSPCLCTMCAVVYMYFLILSMIFNIIQGKGPSLEYYGVSHAIWRRFCINDCTLLRDTETVSVSYFLAF